MNIKKLPTDVQSLLNASSKINNYKSAVEELVFNALDADATSVAVRFHIYDNVIQVIDNGFGIAKCDIPLLGQKYASSKVTDTTSLKNAPIKFGFRGQSLANIIEVSKCVKITTRHKDTDETWVKNFYKAQHKDSQIAVTRPSKGTTVEVKGFLYNLHIQKKATNPLNELQNIKLFLEQLSLVNTNISISLRDNSKNEIIFKVHKNRDIYQTLSSLLNIDRKHLQELQIEKHQYKAKGFIGKQNCDINSYQWIYLNGRFINKCPLHDIVNGSFTKSKQPCRNVKSKNNFLDFEKKIENNVIPSYFIFITCPHLDYDINKNSTKTTIEFKDWRQIRKLLEKLVQFYNGDIKLKNIDVEQIEKKNKHKNTREEVRKIMEKILGSKSKGHKISQLCKGVKGKIVKKKKKSNTSSINRFKNINKISKQSTTGQNSNVPENPSSDIEAPISMNCQVSSKNLETKNNLNVKRLIETNEVKRKTCKLKPIIQQYEKEKIVNNYINNKELAELSHVTDFKENSKTAIEDTMKYSNLCIARDKKSPIKDKKIKRKKEKGKILDQKNDPIMKEYVKETVLEKYSENSEKKKSKINVEHDNLHLFGTNDIGFLQSENNIHPFYEHKLAFNDVTPLSKVVKDCFKSSDLLKTILNSQKAYSNLNEEDIAQFNNPFENKHVHNQVYQQQLQNSERRRNFNIVNSISHRNINQSPDIDYGSFIRKQNGHLRNVQEFFEKKYSDIDKSRAHIQNGYELTSLDQCDVYNRRNTDVNNIESNISPTHVYKSFPKLTFESHKYYLGNDETRNNKLKHFISKQSKENVSPHNNQRTYVTSNKYKSYMNQHYNNKNKTKSSYKYPYFEHKSLHTIEFSTNNLYNANQNTTIDQWKYKITGNVQSTYTILDTNVSLDIASYLNKLNKNTLIHQESRASYHGHNLSSANEFIEMVRHQEPTVIQNLDENDLEEDIPNSVMPAFNVSQKTDEQVEPIDLCEAVYRNNDNFNIVKDKTNNDRVKLPPKDKTGHVFDDSLSYRNDVMSRYFQTFENIQNMSFNENYILINREQSSDTNEIKQVEKNQNNDCHIVENADVSSQVRKDETSRHFDTVHTNQILQMGISKTVFSSEEYSKEIRNVENQSNADNNLVLDIMRIENASNNIEVEMNDVIVENQNMDIDNDNYSVTNKDNKEVENVNCDKDNQMKPNNIEIEANNEIIPNVANNENRKMDNNFKILNRHRFVPKGMSPIFENCNNKNICSYNLETDYFQDDLYNNFANDVLDSIKIYESKVKDMNEVPKKNKDPNCLKFDIQSLKNAEVFGQVDRKFIVAELKSDHLNVKHLVLFDQHAVHERIRLEENLSDYKDGDEWNSINCETLSLKLSKDEFLYLNNFRDKFRQLGLYWKIENESQIIINAVPKAIFGKYCRQADVIIQSIKNLILEEIKAIKTLGGNTLLYPKSIMNLVFSEACRYAIKFGDKLSKAECATLITSLSNCKTPFQCAHGRPVLAVLLDLEPFSYDYKVDTCKILRFKNKVI